MVKEKAILYNHVEDDSMDEAREELTGNHVCPWWFAYTFDNVLRRLVHPVPRVLGSLVREGMTVLDIGCGMGHFSIGMARLVGPKGLVLSVDLQEKMLSVLRRRALRAGLSERIRPLRCRPDDLGLDRPVDFTLAFWMVHETPDAESLFRQVGRALRDGGRLLVAEPSFHVSARTFEHILESAARAGLERTDSPRVAFSRSALFAPGEGRSEGAPLTTPPRR